jgi:hypothetical protein
MNSRDELYTVVRMIVISWRNIVRHIFVSIVEKAMQKSPAIKSCIEEARSNLEQDDPFSGLRLTPMPKTSGGPNPCNEIPLAANSISSMPRDYGKLKGPAKKRYVN